MAAVVVIPTFMEVLDTTIAVVALRYIAGGLSATVDDGEWVLTSYLAANAIILPITGWLSAHLGRRRTTSCCLSPFLLLAQHCAEWPPVSANSSCSASSRAWPAAVCNRAVKACCSMLSRGKSRAWR